MGHIDHIFTTLFARENLTMKQIYIALSCENTQEVLDLVLEKFNEFIHQEELDIIAASNYHTFLFTLNDLITNPEELDYLKYIVDASIRETKHELRDYNKNLIEKDTRYNYLKRILTDLKGNSEMIEESVRKTNVGYDYLTFAHFIFTLRKPDYVFRIMQTNPEYTNLRDQDNNHIFINMIEYVNANINELTEEDIKYFKRIFVMFLESDEFKITNEELFDLLNYLEKNKISLAINKKGHINFFINEINRHYKVINSEFRINAVSYCNQACPIEVIKRKNDERVDLTKLFTVSVDRTSRDEVGNIMIDDALSIVEHNTGLAYDLYIHFPDVDFFVKKDSATDLFMRGIGENVYKKGYRTRMLPFDIANKCSLTHGSKRNAITLKLLIDREGKVLDIEFLKSVINVNYNLTKRKADLFVGPNYNDEVLHDTLVKLGKLAFLLRKNRGEKKSKNTPGGYIIEEYNILADLATAQFFHNEGIIFPYKNYDGKRTFKTASDLELSQAFIREHQIDDANIAIINEALDAYNRVYYDTIARPNMSYKGAISGNVGNPLREYISLETDRVIKDLIINGQQNYSYWEERLTRDCIEMTETTAKIAELKKIQL